ncbi:MAG: hypothetical protein K2X11_07980, partial [Acetobacteraceae bacterium]|nr:hypothetical protein [Acetobacteraceae bacterium]
GLPALPSGARLPLVLARGEAPRGTVPEARHSAVLELTGQAAWRCDLLAQAPQGRPWQGGPLARQWRVTAEVPPEIVGVTSLRLVADVAFRSDGSLWVEVWLRNDAAQREGGGEARYALRLLLDGREALRADVPRHHLYQGWGRLVSTGGAAPHLRFDAGYLGESAAVPRYDVTVGVEEEVLARMAAQQAEAAWAEPLGPRGLQTRMGTTGARFDIGPLTGWQAAWLTSGDRRAARHAMGQAEAAGSIPWHLWDAAQGEWLSLERYPGFWSDARGGRPPRGLLHPLPEREAGWQIDTPHQPAAAFLPYLLSGRRALLDEVIAQAAFNLASTWPAARTPSGREGLLVIRNRQVRGAAWSARALDDAAWAVPPADPNAAYLRRAAERQWSWARGQIPAWTGMQGEAHGWLPPSELGAGGVELAPWQQDYFAAVVALAAQRGNADARAVLGWMENFLVGRFQSGPLGFAPHDGAAYQLAMGAGGRNTPPLTSWGEIAAATRARGLSNGDGWQRSQGDYARLALMSLAMTADALGSARALATWRWLSGAGAPFTDPRTHARAPMQNIVPRGVHRVPQRAPRC